MFKPGQSGNPKGRPKGIPNKTTKVVRETFERVFTQLQEGDDTNLKAWASKNPTEFYKLSTKLIPLQVEAEVNDITDLTEAQRAARAASILALARARREGGDEADEDDASDLV